MQQAHATDSLAFTCVDIVAGRSWMWTSSRAKRCRASESSGTDSRTTMSGEEANTKPTGWFVSSAIGR